MKILLQTNNRKQSQLEHEFKKLTESGFEVVPFGYIVGKPRTEEGLFGSLPPIINLTGLEDLKPSDEIITRSCIPLTKLIKCDKLKTNLYQDIPLFNHTIQYNVRDFDVRRIPDSDYFLNKRKGSWDITAILNILDLVYEFPVFVKPLNDLKLFSGTLVPAGKTLREILIEKNELVLIKNFLEEVLISCYCPEIVQEIRCYVVNRQIITASCYRFEDRLIFEKRIDEDKPSTRQLRRFVKHIIDDVYHPCDNFTIDVAKLKNNEHKIIEYNCLTTSGLYEANTVSLFKSLRDYYYI